MTTADHTKPKISIPLCNGWDLCEYDVLSLVNHFHPLPGWEFPGSADPGSTPRVSERELASARSDWAVRVLENLVDPTPIAQAIARASERPFVNGRSAEECALLVSLMQQLTRAGICKELTLEEARKRLVDALTTDMMSIDRDGLRHMVRNGFAGFKNMTDKDLVQVAWDASLPCSTDPALLVAADVMTRSLYRPADTQAIQASDTPDAQGAAAEAVAQQAAAPTQVCRTIVQFEVLHPADARIDDMGLSALAHECGGGGFVGGNLQAIWTSPLNASELDAHAQRLGSDASFFADDGDADDADQQPTSAMQMRG